MQNTEQLETGKIMAKGNKDLWDKVCTTDPNHTKAVKFGRKFTSVDAYYQIETATELWGQYGAKWALYDIKFIHDEANKVCHVEAMFRCPGESDFEVRNCISTFQRDKYDTDYAKKTVTNTISKALSMLGFSADIFLGKYEDDQYVNDLRNEFNPNFKAPMVVPAPVAVPVQAPSQQPQQPQPTQQPQQPQPTQKSQVQEVSEELSDEIFFIKQAIKNQEAETLKEAWHEISDVDQLVIWTPQSRGGPFTNVERNVISVMRKAQINQSQIANSPNTVMKQTS